MPSHKLRIVYMGTPDFAVLPLKRNPQLKIRPGNRPEDSATREIQGSRFFTGAGRAKSRFAISCGI